MITRVGLVLIPNGETRKKNQKHDMCKIKIQHDFIAKMKQEQNKVLLKKHTQNWCWIEDIEEIMEGEGGSWIFPTMINTW